MTILAAVLLALTTYSVAPQKGNRVSLEVEKTGLMKGRKHVFTFADYGGTLRYDEATPQNSTVAFTLAGASLACEDTWVKESDRKKIEEWARTKMMVVERYPEIRFVSNQVEARGDSSFRVGGMLTMRGMSHPASITVQRSSDGAAFTGIATVDMRQWGMEPPKVGLGTVGTKPEMTLHVSLHLGQAK